MVFGKNPTRYNPIFTQKTKYREKLRVINKKDNPNSVYFGSRKANGYSWVDTGKRYPISVIHAPSIARNQAIHPTQKPVMLLDWLIRTYSNSGDTVLDPVSGSFTTAVAACLSGRNSIGIEKDATYFEAGVERVRKTVVDHNLNVDIEVRR